ncbi:MAG: prepilin-type N-terminal cleavage/methylation domain-containing protein, partial [Alphaproteobacteria bacterium]|nr:prepilin-type N-terminal cleavage/methylation domain-containing protein [Alphaproteobacteria bacterium]
SHIKLEVNEGDIRMSKQTNRQSGFTLVELAVVMIIIGLLIGGVLKGQELITNAQVTSSISQVKGVDAAVSTFRDMYSALPGDMANAGTRLPNCTVAPCLTGAAAGVLGNGTLDSVPSGAQGAESQRFFVHLSMADLVTGVDPQGGQAWGGIYPQAKVGGGLLPSSSTGAAGDFVANAGGARGGLYLTLTTAPAAAPTAATGVVTPNHAFRIDNKIDDGLPASGSVRAFGTNCSTGAAAAATYVEAEPAKVCGLHMRIQG